MAGEIFISYRRADAAWARLLHSQLQAEGVEAWYDAQVGAGQDWRIATAKALEASRIFVLLFSENAAQSDDIAKELAAATLEKKLIIPVRLQNIAPKGAFLYELASRNWVNAYEDTEAKLAELAKGLAHLVRTGARDESLMPFDRADGGAPPPSPMRKRILIAAALLLVLAASTTAIWFLWPARHWTVESSRPFVATLAMEGNPSFSPNGAMLAYTASLDGLQPKIYVRNLAGGDGIKVTSDPYDDDSPSWSSDGGRLAYIGAKAGEPCRVMVTTVPAGEARQVGRCHTAETSSVTWQPNTPFLYYTDQASDQGRYITRLNLETGERLNIKRPLRWLYSLRVSPDSKSLLFLEGGNLAASIVIRELESGKEKNLGSVMGDFTIRMVAWAEDSRTVFVGIGSGSNEIVAYPLDGGARYHVYSTALAVHSMAVGAGGRLALETDLSRKNLARLSKTPISQPDIVDQANGTTGTPTFAPDGTLAFISNRSGSDAIWIAKPGATPARLLDGGGALLRNLRFSPDGTRLTVASISPQAWTVKIITVDGVDIASFETPSIGAGALTWTPDSKALILFDHAADCYVRIDAATLRRRTKLPCSAWDGIVYRPNGIFGMRVDKPGLWRLDGAPKLLNEKYPRRYDPPITFRDDDVLIPDFSSSSPVPRILAQPVTGGPDRVLGFAPGAADRQQDFQTALAVNPKTGEILYTADVGRDTNIDLLTLARH